MSAPSPARRRAAFEAFFTRPAAHVTLEVGTHSRWVSQLLEQLGHRVTIANPRRLKLISTSDSKNDRTDEELLARLGRADTEPLAPVKHRGTQVQADLAVAKARDALVECRTRLINFTRGLVKSIGGRLPACETETFHTQAKNCRACDKQLHLSKKYPDVELVSQPKGVGLLTALVFVLSLEVVWTCGLYLMLWLLPEPTSKLLAAGLTLALLAWLPVHTLWGLMDDWGRLVHDVDRATSFEEVQEASAKFSQQLGQNTANVLVMVVTAVLTAGTANLSAQLPKLPGFAQAAAWAEAQGLSLAGAAEVEAVAAAENETFTLMVRGPGGRAAAEAEEAAAEREGATVIIRHQGGNRQVAGPLQRPALAPGRQQVRPGHSGERSCRRCNRGSGPPHRGSLEPQQSKTRPAQRHQGCARCGRISTDSFDGAHVPGTMGGEATAPRVRRVGVEPDRC